MTRRMRRIVAIVAWLLVVATAAIVIARANFTADLSAFLPTTPTPEQALLIEQLREGPASHLILVAIDGAGTPILDATLAKLSRDTAAALRHDANFLSINNGENLTTSVDRALLFDHRYLLSDQVTAARFTTEGLRQALNDSLDLLSSSAGLMLQALIARDPTAELVHLIDSLTAGRDLPMVDGVWVTHPPTTTTGNVDAHALLIVEVRAAGSDIDGQQIAIDRLKAAFDAARRSTGTAAASARLVLSGPPVFSVDARNTIEREATHLSTIGMVLVASLLGFVYRSPRALALGLIPMITGALCGLAVVAIGFGVVHGITLGFGVTLIGEAVDYAIYLFVQRPSSDAGARSSRFWATIALGVATSVIGFAALTFSGFQGLAQIGVLSIVGLVVAAVVTRWVLPAMLPVDFTVRSMPKLGALLRMISDRAPSIRWPVLTLGIAACVVLVLHRDVLWSRDLSALSPISSADQETDQSLRSELGAPDVRDLVVISAATQEAALRGSEAVVAMLTPLIASGQLVGVEAPSRYLPSRATQQARQSALPDDASLHRDFAQALGGLPFTKTGFAGFFADVAREKTGPLLASTDLDGTSLAPALRALLTTHDTDAKGTQRWTAVVALRSHVTNDVAPSANELPRARIAADLVRISIDDEGHAAPVIRLIDIRNETQNLYAGYLYEAVRMAGFGGLAIVVLLSAVLRDGGRVARVLAPLMLAVVLVAAAHVAWGGPLNLFHFVGLLLIVAVGSNYALFFDRRSRDDDERRDHVLTSLLVANLTAVIGFGVLGLSSLPVLHSIGTTVAPGALLALWLSAVFARESTPGSPTT
jgi:predicted exporter